MLLTLSGIAACVFLVGLLYSMLAAGRVGWRQGGTTIREAQVAWLPWVALLVLAAGVAMMLPARTATTGYSAAWGMLIGGSLTFLAFWFSAIQARAERHAGDAVAFLSVGGLGVAVVLLLFRAAPQDALTGCALGAIVLSALFCGVLRVYSPDSVPPLYRGIEMYGLAVLALVAGVRLGMLHFPGVPTATAGGYWAFPLLLLSAGVLGAILFSSDRPGSLLRRRPWISATIAGGIMVGVTVVMQLRLLPRLDWQVPLYGLLAFGVILAFLLQEEHHLPVSRFRPMALTFGLVFLTLAVVMLAFRRLAGYGEALTLLPVLLLVAVSYLRADAVQRPLAAALGVGGFTLLLLFTVARLLISGTGPSILLDFQRHYDMLTLIIGVGAALGVMGYMTQHLVLEQADGLRARLPAWSAALRTLLLLVMMGVAPLAILSFFGVRSLLAYLLGFAIGEIIWLALAAWSSGHERLRVLLAAPHVYLLTAMIAAVQFAPAVLALDLSRTQRVTMVIIIAALAILWVLLDTLLHARDKQEGADHVMA